MIYKKIFFSSKNPIRNRRFLQIILALFCSFYFIEYSYSKEDALESDLSEKRDNIDYVTDFQTTHHADIDASLKAVSQLAVLEKTHAVGPYALAGRIRQDYERLQGALQSHGYYSGKVDILVEAQKGHVDGHDPFLATQLQKISQKNEKIRIKIKIELGPIFHIRAFLFLPPVPLSSARDDEKISPKRDENFQLSLAEKQAFKLKEGDEADASEILSAQGRLMAAMQEEGYALATISIPQVILQPQTHTLDVRFYAAHGPKVLIGHISLQNMGSVKEDYLRRRLLIKTGQLYQPSAIEQARTELNDRGLFASVEVRNNPPLENLSLQDNGKKDGAASEKSKQHIQQAMPLNFKFIEAKKHNISGTLGYSTDLGGRAGVSWLHRNLLGRGESLKLSVLATGLGGSAQQGLGYDIFADFNKPDFMVRDRLLNLHAEAVRQLLYSYHQTAWFLRGGFSQPLNKEWSLSVAGSVEEEQIKQFGKTTNYFIIALPLQATYDTTKRSNPIEPATHGIRVNLGITPSESLEHKARSYVVMNAQISAYYDLAHLGISQKGNSILAVRGLVGSIQGATTWNIPPDQRFYAGGPATVRGYRYQGVGPQIGKYAVGGTSVDAATIELRQRLYHNIGMAVFSDAGQVGKNSMPGHGKLRIGYGAGLRYFTPIGPVRVDVALPSKRPARGDKWELYIGLGETF